MTIVAVANQKGGVGKTTLTLAIASEVARRGKRALVVDADPQANATDTIAGEDFDADDAPTLYDALVAGDDGAAAGAIRESSWPGVDLVPGDIQVARYDEYTGIGSEQRLRTALAGIEGYDIILIDCPRALGALTSAALTAADQVLVVAEPTKDSLKGVAMVMESTETVRKHYNHDLMVAGVVLNRFGRTKARSVRADQLREALGEQVWEPPLPEWSAIARINEAGDRLPIIGPDTDRAAQAGRIISTYADRLLAGPSGDES